MSDYSTLNLEDENFDILQFWHQVKGVFPILSAMAHDIFAVPVSTVASESCFSAANRILTDKRTRLGPNVFEALVLLKDWYDAETRVQDKSWMHAVDIDENPEHSVSTAVTSETQVDTNQPQTSQPDDQSPSYANPYMYNYEEYGYYSFYNDPRYYD